MELFVGILWASVTICLVVVAAMRPRRVTTSRLELHRRQDNGDNLAAGVLQREERLDDIASLLHIVTALLLVIAVALNVTVFGWLVGIIVSLVVALGYGRMASSEVVAGQAQKVYEKFEPKLLEFTEKFAGLLQFVRSVSLEQPAEPKLESRDQLEHLVTTAGSILSADEKKLIISSLHFGERAVSEVMTPRAVIDSVAETELLGPLVLDDLHKTGHSRFPVIQGDIDHIVGMLYVQDLMTLNSGKSSTTAKEAMSQRVFYIREDQTLAHALSAFLRTRHHLFVVVNEYRETVGLLSLEDVIEELLGRKINDEFDSHEDLRAVAMRNPRGNNKSEKSNNV